MATSMNFHMVEIDHDEFNCPLCLDIFDTPKSIPKCAHKLCKSCLSDLIQKNGDYEEVECPICRQRSPLPSEGVEGFPTDTFLVRCIEKIPGVVEKREIKHAISRCKKEIEKKQDVRENLEKKLENVDQNKKLSEELKKQVSSHASEIIKSVKKREEEMCKLIDNLVENEYGVVSRKKVEKEIKHLGDYLEVAQNCVFNVEETLNSDNVNEIIEMKEFIKDQLNEYSDYPVSMVLKDVKNLKPFDVTFKKSEVSSNDVLGKLINGGQEVNSLSEPCSNSSLSVTEGIHVDWDDIGDDDSTPTDVLHTVKLSFCPTRIAVSPISYDIAVLCKEQRKVHIYSPDAEHKGVIKVAYGNLSDMCFSSQDNVAILNRENNRILMYTKDSNFKRTKFHVPCGNLKYTYLSRHNDQLIVVSTSEDDDGSDGDDIDKCIVIHDENNPSSFKMFGEFQLSCPVSRAVYYDEKFFIADMNENGQVVIKTFSESDLVLVGEIRYSNGLHSFPITEMVSILHDDFSDPMMCSILHVGYPGDGHFDVFIDDHCLGKRRANQAKQREIIPSEAVATAHRYAGNLVQVEIYNSQKLFKLIQSTSTVTM